METAVRDWLNAELGSTTLPGGAHLTPVNSPETEGWAVIGRTGGGTDTLYEQATVSVAVYGGTWPVAERAAQAVVALLDAQQGAGALLPGGVWRLLVVDGRAGPYRAPDPNGDLPGFLVTADLYLQPA